MDSIVQELFSYQHTSHPVILRGAEGEVAESIIQKITLALRERGDRRRRWVRARQKHFLTPLILPGVHLLPREKVFLRFWKQWILQLRASPSCRMTWGWGERLEEESTSYWCSLLRNNPDRINHQLYCTFETISYRLQQPIYLTWCLNNLKMYLHFDLEKLRNADLKNVHWIRLLRLIPNIINFPLT